MSKLTDAIEQNMLDMVARSAALANPQTTLDTQKLIQLIYAQARTADMWIQQWEQYKDVGGVRNASLAIGKIFGIYNALLALNGGGMNAPDDVIELMQKYQTIWNDLYISKTIASAIAAHG